MRERDLIRLRAQMLARAYGYEDTLHLKGTARIAYRYLLCGLRQLSEWNKRQEFKAKHKRG
jgi:hypothetical protein